MQFSDLMLEGVNLLVLGMGSVFIFLTVLVMVMKATSWFAMHIGSQEEEIIRKKRSHTPVRDSGVDSNIIPVISAAIAIWRQRHN